MTTHNQAWILEACILATLSEKETYGYELAKLNLLGISQSTIYPVLRRLTEKGHLNVSKQVYQTRQRKIYSISPTGLNQLKQYKNDWFTFQNTVNEIVFSH